MRPTIRNGDQPTRDLYDTIFGRRDVRNEFNGAAIPDDVLDHVLAAAHAAPSVGLSQPWDFILIKNVAVRERFRDHVYEERRVFAEQLPADRAGQFAPIKIEGILESTMAIVVTYDASRAGPHVLGRHAIADAGLYSTCLAIENLWLAATAEGLGVGWVSFYRESFLRDVLGIPESVRPVAWLCIGPVDHFEEIPDLERFNWRSRMPLSSVIRHEHW